MKRALLIVVLVVAGVGGFLMSRAQGGDETPQVKDERAVERHTGTIAAGERRFAAEVHLPEQELQERFQLAREAFRQKGAISGASPAELHRTPKVTIDAARLLAGIVALEAQEPERAEAFQNFYLECARSDETITVIRAQCLNRFVQAGGLDEAGMRHLLAGFPADVRRLFLALRQSL